MTLDAAAKIDAGSHARVEIGIIKVAGAKMLHNVIDRAIIDCWREGADPRHPLRFMYRHAREARIYDGPDDVHVTSIGKRLLKAYAGNVPGIDFGGAA